MTEPSFDPATAQTTGAAATDKHPSPPPARAEHYAHAPLGTGAFDADRLAEITDGLGEPHFPATRESLVDLARERGAREAVVVDLRSLPPGSAFADYDELLAALGVGAQGDIDRPQLNDDAERPWSTRP